MSVHIVEFYGQDPGLVEGLCLHPDDPPRMRRVMTPYVEQRKAWLRRMVHRGLRVAVALAEDGDKQGLVEYVPIEWAAEPVNGAGSLFINCLWVLPRYWKAGVGQALMDHVIAQARAVDRCSPPPSSGDGITLLAYDRDKWFGYFPYMPVRFFKRWGFSEVDRDGTRVLLHLDLGHPGGSAVHRERGGTGGPSMHGEQGGTGGPSTHGERGGTGGPSTHGEQEGAGRPSLIRPGARVVAPTGPAPHVVEVLYSSQCPWSGWMIDGVMAALKKFDVEVRLVSTDERAAVQEYGLTRGVCVDGQPLIKRLASGREIARAVERYLKEHPG